MEGLLGDKLTAFAPHTTGILYGAGKELEIAKQLFDIGTLFDVAIDVSLVGQAFENVAATQLAYRGLRKLKPADILQDAFDTACMIGMRGISRRRRICRVVGRVQEAGSLYLFGTFHD